MGSPNNIVLIDMDGTICDYVGAMHTTLRRLKPESEPWVDPFTLGDSPNHQYLWERMEMIKASEEWWATLPKLTLGFDLLNVARGLGFRAEILTQAPKNNPAALSGKLKWIRKNLEDIDFTMTRDKSKVYGRILIDDFPGYVIPWLKNRPRGGVIMPANRYNEGFEHSRAIRYDGTNLDKAREFMEEFLVK